MSTNDGGPAFPELGMSYVNLDEETINVYRSGATLRDYFAARIAAAQSVTTSADTNYMAPDWVAPNCHGATVAQRIARIAYEVADAMLLERTK